MQKQPTDCTTISHHFFMGENWELTLLSHFIPMEYFHTIVEMLQTFHKEQKVTILSVTSSIFC